MFNRIACLLTAVHLLSLAPSHTHACCPAPPPGKAVVNADQTVIIVWDAATKTEHFIRQASFKSEADDFGFIIPTPSQPVLDESWNEAFGFLAKLTAPEIVKTASPSGGMGCGCSKREMSGMVTAAPVRVLDEKTVAGFNAVVLEADSSAALVKWLKDNGYAYSSEIEAWAKPYIENGWKMTALKVAKDPGLKAQQNVAASALRISFKTDRPLFPYREPDSKTSANALGITNRLLRIYFLADARYQGDLDGKAAWTGTTPWSNPCKSDDWVKVMGMLKLPQTASPATPWLTEFEDNWPYRLAPADLYFAPSTTQETVKRPPIVQYVSSGGYSDAAPYALVLGAIFVIPRFFARIRRDRLR